VRRTWTIIAVRDVSSSLKWYQALLGLTPSTPEHDYFGQVLDADGTVLLCLHRWGDHEHPSLSSPGNGLLLFLRVDDFDATLSRARNLDLRLEEEPHINPGTKTMEFSLLDLDGYYVSISALAATKTERGS
jgi:catechol 2,3-dioxygenase-like lactoylglutathione lyase family enzyme